MLEALECAGIAIAFVAFFALFTRYHEYFDRLMDKWYALCRKGR